MTYQDAGYIRLKEQVDSMNQQYKSQGGGGRGWYWWMYVMRDGRPTILGMRPTETQAREYLYQTVPNENGQVICLDTRDLSSAVRKIKSRILETSHDLDKATIKMVRSQFKKSKDQSNYGQPLKQTSHKESSEWREYF